MISTTLSTFLQEHLQDYTLDLEHYAYSLPDRAISFAGLSDLRAKVTASGSHFFDRESIRFFKSKDHELYGGRFLVVSIQDRDLPRVYTVRWVYKYEDSDVLQVARLASDFSTLQEAREAAKRLRALVDGKEG